MNIQLVHVAARDGGGVSLKVRLSNGEHREVRHFALTDADWRRIAQSIKQSPALADGVAISLSHTPLPCDCAEDPERQAHLPPRPTLAKWSAEDIFSSLAGCLLTPEQFDDLECAATFCAALNKGAELLSYGANSKRALALKLRRYGYDDELCSRVGAELCSRGLIREASDAASIVRSCLRSGYGKSRIIAKLRQKGYGDEPIREALDSVDESVYDENCVALIRKKFGCVPSDANERRKMAALLVRYGYSFGQIKSAMLAMMNDE